MKRADILSLATALILTTPLPAMAEEHGGGGQLPQLDVALYPGVIFWFVLVFVAFFLFMQFVGIPGIQRTQGKRASILETDLDSARASSEAAEQIAAGYEAALNSARHKANATVGDILVEAAKEADLHGEKLQKELQHRTHVAEENIAMARQKAMEEAPKFVNDLVNELFSKVTKVSIGARG